MRYLTVSLYRRNKDMDKSLAKTADVPINEENYEEIDIDN